MADGKVRININAYSGTKGLTLNALSQELTHFIKQWSPDKYKALAEYLIKTYEGTNMTMHKRVVREQNRLKEIRKEDVSYDEAYDEVVANAFNRLLEDGKVMERIAEIRKMDKSLAEKIIERIRDFIKRFTNAYRRNPSFFRDSEALMKMKEAVDQLQELFVEALVEASDNFRAVQGIVYDFVKEYKNIHKGQMFSSQQTDIDATDVVKSASGTLAVNINSQTSGLIAHKKGEWSSVIAKQIRAVLSEKSIYAADGDIITVTNRGAREVAHGTDSINLRKEAKESGNYEAVERKMFTAEHAASIISLSVYKSWSKNEDLADRLKKDGINHRVVNLWIDGELYETTVLTALSADENDVRNYGEKFYDIVSIEKQTNQSATSGDTNMVSIPHKIKFADDSSDKLTVAQKQRIVNRQNVSYSTGDVGTKTSMAEALANAKRRKSTQQTDISNRELLANAFENLVQNSEEYKMLQEYK